MRRVGDPRADALLDLTAFEGQPVSSAAAGRVIYAGRRGSYGLHVEVAHQNGYTTRYAHLSAVLVEWGQRVSAGSLIGRAGQTGRATGPHLHFELWQNGLPIDPFDAMPEPQHGREAPADRRHLSMR